MKTRTMMLLALVLACSGCRASFRSGPVDITTLTCFTRGPGTAVSLEQRLDAQWVDLRVTRAQPLESVLRALIGEEWPASGMPIPRRLEDGATCAVITRLRADGVTLREALDEVAAAASLTWSLERGQLVFRRS